MTRTRRLWALFAAVTGMALVLGVPRVRAGPVAVVDGEPVTVQAARLEVDLQKGTALLLGDVTMRRGDLEIRCSRVEARYDSAPNVTFARAQGNVRARLRDFRARAGVAELHMKKRALVLRGNVKLWRGGAFLEAREAEVDLQTQRVTLQQVKGTFPVGKPSRSGP